MDTIQLANAVFLPHVCDLVKEGHTVSIRAKGYSMRPFIENDRDVAVLAKMDSCKVGDVVLAEVEPGHFILHRIDAINGDMVRLRGDGNYPGTEICTLNDLRAKMWAVVRKGKTWHTDGTVWKVYSWFWVKALPIRGYLLTLYRLLWLGQCPNKIKKLFMGYSINSPQK
ncbi:MAG: S24/S26 family peptidase [Bacteroidaceae bacterium]|nr:S24/S26 family peptidase [Bacteroidaceae bacterium]